MLRSKTGNCLLARQVCFTKFLLFLFVCFGLFVCFCSKYKVDCACVKGNQECPVLKHNLEPTENLGSGGRRRGNRKDKELARDDQAQNQNVGLDGEGKGKNIGDSKQRKLSPLRLSISNNQARLLFNVRCAKHAWCQSPFLTLLNLDLFC